MTDITIPAEVEEAIAKRLYESMLRRANADIPVWQTASEYLKMIVREEAKELAKTALAAWPGMGASSLIFNGCIGPHLILPLPARNEEGK